MPLETGLIHSEITNTFVDGSFIATILLCVAFIEHWLTCILSSHGFEKESKAGLDQKLKCLKRNQLTLKVVIKKVDQLRKKRNPFVHLRSFDDPNTISQRIFKEKKDLITILEEDARESILLMHAVARYIQ